MSWSISARSYIDVTIAGDVFCDVAWIYARPTPAFASLRDHVALYAASFDQCLVYGERVTAQSAGFYGGWITSTHSNHSKALGSRFW